MGKKCKGKTRQGRPCMQPPTPGVNNGYCLWHYPGEIVKWGLPILNTAKNIWEIIKGNLPKLLTLSVPQLVLFKKLTKTKSRDERMELLTQLFKSLSAAQVLQLVTAIASHVPASKAAQNRRLHLIATLVSVLSQKPMQRGMG